MTSVSSCPKTKMEYMEVSRKCDNDTNGHSQYICLPNQEKTSLVELCYNEVMGIREKGYCLEASVGKLIQHSCLNFSSGCPNETFWDYGYYKYPACQTINTKHHCYVMDPSCPSQVSNEDLKSHDAVVYTFSFLGVVIVLILAVVAVHMWTKRGKASQTNKNDIEGEGTTINNPTGAPSDDKIHSENGDGSVHKTTGGGRSFDDAENPLLNKTASQNEKNGSEEGTIFKETTEGPSNDKIDSENGHGSVHKTTGGGRFSDAAENPLLDKTGPSNDKIDSENGDRSVHKTTGDYVLGDNKEETEKDKTDPRKNKQKKPRGEKKKKKRKTKQEKKEKQKKDKEK